MKFLRFCVTSIVLTISALGSGTSAQATPGDSISLYFSAPFVTGSAVTDGVETENFNSYSSGACPTSIAGFATVTYSAGNCTISSNVGTSPGDSSPAIGVPLSTYVDKTLNTTFTFETDVKYVGFWWMMGSNGNNVEFLDSNGDAIATFNVNDVLTFLGPNSSVSNSDTRTVTNVGGGTYPTRHFYRSPSNYTGTLSSPIMEYNTMTYANEPWIYLNLYVAGSLSVSKVRFTGSNFEFDNLTVTASEVDPTDDLVLVKKIYEAPLDDQVVTWAPTNTTYSGTDPELIPDVEATSSGTGAITYEVVDAGTAGCTVEASTGAITYTAIGDCVIRAVAAEVPGSYNSAHTDVTFTFLSVPGPKPPTSSKRLAFTGFDGAVPLGLGIASLIAGFGAVRFARRRR